MSDVEDCLLIALHSLLVALHGTRGFFQLPSLEFYLQIWSKVKLIPQDVFCVIEISFSTGLFQTLAPGYVKWTITLVVKTRKCEI